MGLEQYASPHLGLPMFRFTIRELVLLTVIVAMGAAWWAHQDRLKREHVEWKHRATATKMLLLGHGWQVYWDEGQTEFVKGSEQWSCPLPKDGRYVLRRR